MNSPRHAVRRSLAAVFALLALSIAAGAQSKEQSQFPDVKIKNFGQMDERFFRGAQPKPDDYRALAALGVKTLIDLREDPTDYEKPMAEAAGMGYVNIPIVDKKDPSEEQVAQFLKLVSDPATGKFYVHCAGGRHRTGVMGAVYRFNLYGWNFDQVYAEMKQYDFYTAWGHGGQKKYVENYWQRIQSGQIHVAAAPAPVAVTSAASQK